VEIKSAQTYKNSFSTIFDYFKRISSIQTKNTIIYRGKEQQKRTNFNLVPWNKINV